MALMVLGGVECMGESGTGEFRIVHAAAGQGAGNARTTPEVREKGPDPPVRSARTRKARIVNLGPKGSLKEINPAAAAAAG